MTDVHFKQYDFDNPSFLFKLEDKLKYILGGPLFYNSYLKTFNLKGDEKVLDFGCGGGSGSICILNFLNENGRLTCIDTSTYWMQKATNRLNKFSNVKCLTGDVRELDLPDAEFDVISTIHVLHDIEPAARQDIIRSLAKTLKSDGLFFIREPIKESHGMPIEEIRSLFSNAGLKEIEYSATKAEYRGKYCSNKRINR